MVKRRRKLCTSPTLLMAPAPVVLVHDSEATLTPFCRMYWNWSGVRWGPGAPGAKAAEARELAGRQGGAGAPGEEADGAVGAEAAEDGGVRRAELQQRRHRGAGLVG